MKDIDTPTVWNSIGVPMTPDELEAEHRKAVKDCYPDASHPTPDTPGYFKYLMELSQLEKYGRVIQIKDEGGENEGQWRDRRVKGQFVSSRAYRLKPLPEEPKLVPFTCETLPIGEVWTRRDSRERVMVVGAGKQTVFLGNGDYVYYHDLDGAYERPNDPMGFLVNEKGETV